MVTETTSSEQILPVAPPCPIEAAYGSDMAPEVVYIRYVRDELIGSTPTGKALVHAFNIFYYSWAPPLAAAIAGSEILRAVFRALLLPLAGIVRVTAVTFSALASMTGNRDVASLLAFLGAASMSGGAYVALPALVTAKLERKIRRMVATTS